MSPGVRPPGSDPPLRLLPERGSLPESSRGRTRGGAWEGGVAAPGVPPTVGRCRGPPPRRGGRSAGRRGTAWRGRVGLGTRASGGSDRRSSARSAATAPDAVLPPRTPALPQGPPEERVKRRVRARDRTAGGAGVSPGPGRGRRPPRASRAAREAGSRAPCGSRRCALGLTAVVWVPRRTGRLAQPQIAFRNSLFSYI